MGELVALPVSSLRKLATVWQDEERAFETVLDVLRESRRFDLVLKIDTFQRVRHKRLLRLLMKKVKDSSLLGAGPDADARGDGPHAPGDSAPFRRGD